MTSGLLCGSRAYRNFWLLGGTTGSMWRDNGSTAIQTVCHCRRGHGTAVVYGYLGTLDEPGRGQDRDMSVAVDEGRSVLPPVLRALSSARVLGASAGQATASALGRRQTDSIEEER